jgi:hypothetical protein
MFHRYIRRGLNFLPALCCASAFVVSPLLADEPGEPGAAAKRAEQQSQAKRSELESALAKMLSGATLEGSFTSTGAGSDPTRLAREKYTLGAVKKVSGDVWQIPARIQYGDKDVAIPIMLPIHWAGDTPVVTVDNLALPGFGAVSARVIFFDGHYAGYWKHGAHGGHLFGVIHPAGVEKGGDKKSAAGVNESSRAIDRQRAKPSDVK